MIALVDIDSMFFKSVYRIVTLTEIKGYYLANWTKEEVFNEIIDTALHRLDNTVIQIMEEVESTGVSIDDIQYFITTCEKSFRKSLSKDYKAKRKSNKYVSSLRKKFMESVDNIHFSSTHEADDLIASAVDSMEETDYIIVTMDKDVKNLVGLHYDYYKHPKEESMRGLGFTTQLEHERFLAYQMLVGDNSDGIKGCKGIGDKTANKILDGKKGFGLIRSVYETYIKKNHTKEDIEMSYKLLKLGL